MNDKAGHDAALTRLIAKDAITEVLNRFARGADSANLDLIRSVYWPEATDDHGNFSGNAMEFAEHAMDVLKRFRTTMQYPVLTKGNPTTVAMTLYAVQLPTTLSGTPLLALAGLALALALGAHLLRRRGARTPARQGNA